jgi:hypothetical protein
MRRILFMAASLVILSNVGCLLNAYPSDPVERMKVLMNQSENERIMQGEWERFWMVDQPTHLTPDRTDGGTR